MKHISLKPQCWLAVLFCCYHNSRQQRGYIEAQRGPQTTPVAPFHDTAEAVWEWHELGTKYPEEMSGLRLQVGGEGMALQTASGWPLLAN